MPKLEDIEQFKRQINSLGNEEQILAERGEKIVDIPPPEQGVPDDISALLNDISDVAESSDVIPGEGESPDVFDTDLGSLPDEGETGPETSAFDETGSIPDLDSMFESSESDIESDLMSDELVAETAEEDFSLPDLEELPETAEGEASEDLSEDMSGMFDMPEDLDLDEDLISDTSDIGDIEPESFDIPSSEEFAAPEESAEEIGGTIEDFGNIEPSEAGDFDISDLGEDFSIPDIDSEQADVISSEETSEDLMPDDIITPDEAAPPFDESSADDFSGMTDVPDSDFSLLEGEEAVSDEFDEGLDFDAGELEAFDLPDDLDDGAETADLAEEPVFDEVPQDAGIDEEFEMPPEPAEGRGDTDIESFESETEDFEIPDISEESQDDVSEFEDFDLPEDLDADLEPETAAEESAELPQAEPAAESDEEFDLGSLEDISLDDEFEITPDDDLEGEDSLGSLEDLGDLEDVGDISAAPEASAGEADEFSLEDLGEEYSSLEEIEEEIIPESPGAGDFSGGQDYAVPETAEEDLEFSIDQEKLGRVTDTLNQLPRNLKLTIEDLIGNKGLSGKRLNNLVDKLATGASVKEIAGLAEKITGRKIRIPSQYERKTWEELEEEKKTFAYILRHQILPYAGKVALFTVALFFTVFVIKKQVYDPVYSSYLYNRGFEQLENENYKASDRLFNKASRLKPFKKQFYRYAEGYIERREYTRAEQKYTEMLGRALSSEREKSRKDQHTGYFPTDKKGFLDFAVLKTFYMGEYAESDRILDDFILQKGNKWDYEALLARIDNFLNWGELENKQFDSAEYVLNDSLSKFGNKPGLIFRKMAYYFHSGKINILEEKALSDVEAGEAKSVDARKYYSILGEFRNYVENIKEKYADSYMIADYYRYMIDHDNLDGVEEKLISVSNQDKNLIEPHYQLSRYWNRMEKKDLERRALSTIENLLNKTDMGYIRDNYPHSYNYAVSQRNRMDILTQNRLGKFYYNDNEILDAQRYYKKAVDRFEKYYPLPGDTASYGHIYEDLGDVYYYNAGKYNEALKYYAKAFNTGYKTDNLDYKIGFINYKNRNYSKAAEKFYDISLNARENEAALFAFANASFNYDVFSPAKAYYDRVIEKMEYWREHEKVFDLDRRKDQREVLEKLMQVYNNQGVTLFKLAEKNHNQEYYSKSLVYLSQSSELYDTLMRDPVTMDKTLTKPLAQLNMKWILLNSGWKNSTYAKSVVPYSSDNMSLDSPVIYNSIDHDLYGRVSRTLK